MDAGGFQDNEYEPWPDLLKQIHQRFKATDVGSRGANLQQSDGAPGKCPMLISIPYTTIIITMNYFCRKFESNVGTSG